MCTTCEGSSSFLRERLEVLQEGQVSVVLIGGAELDQLVGKFFVDSSLVQHVHQEVIEILEKKKRIIIITIIILKTG